MITLKVQNNLQAIQLAFQSSPPDIVTGDWIKEKMNKHKIGNKKIGGDTGVPKSEISAMINGHREMGIRTKSMFYYLFKWYEFNNSQKILF